MDVHILGAVNCLQVVPTMVVISTFKVSAYILVNLLESFDCQQVLAVRRYSLDRCALCQVHQLYTVLRGRMRMSLTETARPGAVFHPGRIQRCGSVRGQLKDGREEPHLGGYSCSDQCIHSSAHWRFPSQPYRLQLLCQPNAVVTKMHGHDVKLVVICKRVADLTPRILSAENRALIFSEC